MRPYDPNDPRVIRELLTIDPTFEWSTTMDPLNKQKLFVLRSEFPFNHFISFNSAAIFDAIPPHLHEVIDGNRPFRFFMDLEIEPRERFDFATFQAERTAEQQAAEDFEAMLSGRAPEHIAPVTVHEADFYRAVVGNRIRALAQFLAEYIADGALEFAAGSPFNAIKFARDTFTMETGESLDIDIDELAHARDIVILDASSETPRAKMSAGGIIEAPPKISFHVIFTNLYVANFQYAAALTEYLRDKFAAQCPDFAAAIDILAIKKKTFFLRMPGASKADEPRRMFRLYGHNPERPRGMLHLMIQRPAMNQAAEYNAPAGLLIGAGYIAPAKQIRADIIPNDQEQAIIATLMARYPQYFEGYAYWHFAFSCFKFTRVGRSPICAICAREHTHTNAAYVLFTRGRFFYRCFRDPQKRSIELLLEDPAPLNIADVPDYLADMNVITQDYRGVKIIEQQFIGEAIGEEIDAGERTILVRSGCGTGKTVGLEHAFESARIRGFESILMLSTRKAFTNEKAQQFGLESYLDYQDKVIPMDIPRFIIQYESLFRLDNNYYPAVVVLDEFESILEQIQSNQSDGNDSRPLYNLLMFENLIKRADVVIVLDANLTTFSADYFKAMRPTPSILLNLFKVQRDVIHYAFEEHIVAEIFSALKLGRRVVVCSDMCSELEKLQLQVLKEHILEENQIRIITGATRPELDDEIKAGQTITEIVSRYRLVCYNTALLAGISIEDEGLTEVFTICSKKFISPVSMFQMICRIRALKTLHIYAEDSKEAPTTFEEEAARTFLTAVIRPREFYEANDRLAPLPRLLVQHRVGVHNSRARASGCILALWQDSGANLTAAENVQLKVIHGNTREAKQKKATAIAAAENKYFADMLHGLCYDYSIHSTRKHELTPEMIERLTDINQRESLKNLRALNNARTWAQMQTDDRALLAEQGEALTHQTHVKRQESARDRLRAIEIMSAFGLNLESNVLDSAPVTKDEATRMLRNATKKTPEDPGEEDARKASTQINKFLKRVFGAQIKSTRKVRGVRGAFKIVMDEKLLTRFDGAHYYIELQTPAPQIAEPIVPEQELQIENVARVDPL